MASQLENSSSQTVQPSCHSIFSSFMRKYAEKPGAPVCSSEIGISTTRSTSSKLSPKSSYYIKPSKSPLDAILSPLNSRKNRNIQPNQFSVCDQGSSLQEKKKHSNTNLRSRSPENSQQVSDSFAGALDRHTFYSSNFSLFDVKPQPTKSFESSASHLYGLSQYVSPKATKRENSNTIKKEKLDSRMNTNRSQERHEPKILATSKTPAKYKQAFKSKQLECIVQNVSPIGTRTTRTPQTMKHIVIPSPTGFSNYSESFFSVKHSLKNGKFSPHFGIPKHVVQSPSPSIRKPKKIERPASTKKNYKGEQRAALEAKDLNLIKSSSLDNKMSTKNSMRSPSNLKKSPVIEPNSSDYGKYNKIFKGIDNKSSWRFAPERYQRLGKGSAENTENCSQETYQINKSITKGSQTPSKELRSQSTKPEISVIPEELVSSIHNIENILSGENSDKVTSPENLVNLGSVNSTLQLDDGKTISSIGVASDLNLELKERVRSLSSMRSLEIKSPDLTDRSERDRKLQNSRRYKEQIETFGDFFSGAVTYLCDFIDCNDPEPTERGREKNEEHFHLLLDHIVREIYVLKRGLLEVSERAGVGKRLLVLLDMALRSFVCLIRRKDSTIRRFYNRSFDEKVNGEKKKAGNYEKYQIKFEELCGLEGEYAICEENERNVRDKLCHEIRKRREELEDLEKMLKEAKKSKFLHCIQSVKIKVNNALNSNKKKGIKK